MKMFLFLTEVIGGPIDSSGDFAGSANENPIMDSFSKLIFFYITSLLIYGAYVFYLKKYKEEHKSQLTNILLFFILLAILFFISNYFNN